MRIFGLTPSSVLERSKPADIKPQPTLAFSMLYGSASFGAVSVLAYAIWAFRLIPGIAAMYAAIALIYIGLSGLALSRLASAPGIRLKFSLLFATAFFCYAILWCLFWFWLKSKYHGDLYGSALGLAAMVFLFQRAFGVRNGFLSAFAILFTFHTLGYYIGGELYALSGGATGRLLWGAAHGLGFGAGLGNLMHACQAPLRDAIGKLGTSG